MRLSILVAALAVAVTALSCKPDPARSVKIADSTPGAAPFPRVLHQTLPPWQESNCKLAPDEAAGSTFTASGPCAFTHAGIARCRAQLDDGHIMVLRNAIDGGTVGVYINVETYTGPKTYHNAQMFLTYQKGSSYYHWGNDSVTITVSPGLKSVVLPPNPLPAEPPNTGTEVVSGKLICAPTSDSSLTNPRG